MNLGVTNVFQFVFCELVEFDILTVTAVEDLLPLVPVLQLVYMVLLIDLRKLSVLSEISFAVFGFD